ncbi:MAG: NAD(P)H-quinone oxidoreductase [Acidobacteria bacterium]|nr:NAD(P)H-quinone oxidoreductase [Acidobacteriota bacterium]
MRAIEIAGAGGPEVLVPVERPDPHPGPGEVLIDVHAAGVNRPDLMQREGRYPPPPGVTDIPGLEVAGRIVAIGSSEVDAEAEGTAAGAASAGDRPRREWQVGDVVMALVAGGGYAELVAAPAVQCLPIPAGLSTIEAAAMPETYFTVWTNVFELGRLRPGERLLVHGGAGGIGTTAIQMAVARGASVIATAGTDAKCRACERLGAARVVNYRSEDFVAAVADATGGRGVDVVLDIVGGDYTPRNLSCLAMDGRLVQIAVMGGVVAAVPLFTIMRRRLTLTGSTLRPRTPAEKGAIAAAVEREIWPLVEVGRVRPVIDRTYPLADAADAHRRLESGDAIGKVVLLR